jgi:hypothetical protein
MKMIPLRRGAVHRRMGLDVVALKNCNAVEIITKDARTDEAGDTPTNHNRMFAEPTRHRASPLRDSCNLKVSSHLL